MTSRQCWSLRPLYGGHLESAKRSWPEGLRAFGSRWGELPVEQGRPTWTIVLQGGDPVSVMASDFRPLLLTLNDRTRHLDILLTCHEDENISWGIRQMNLQDLLDRTIDVIFAG